MKLIFIIVVILIVFSSIFASSNITEDNFIIDVKSQNKSNSEIVYSSTIEIQSFEDKTFELKNLNDENFAVFQLHSFFLNMTLSHNSNIQVGTNLGLVITKKSSQNIVILNQNLDIVQCLIVVIIYNSLPSPLPDRVKLEETNNLIIASIPLKKNDSTVDITGYFTYLEANNFTSEAYFDGIRRMIFESAMSEFKTYDIVPLNRKVFEKRAGTGMIINFVVNQTFFIPSATFSCPENTLLLSQCSDLDLFKRSLCVFLVIFSVIMIVNVLKPDIFDSIMSGILIGGFIAFVMIDREEHDSGNSEVEILIIIFIGGTIVSFILAVLTLYIRKLGRFLVRFIFSCLLIAIFMETCYICITSIYIFIISAFLITMLLMFIRISFSVLLGGLIMILSLSRLLKVGNIHRIIENHFLSLIFSTESIFSFSREKFINYRVQLNILDFTLICFYLLGSILLTLRKELLIREMQMYEEIDSIGEYNRRIARYRVRAGIIGIRKSNQLKIVSRCRRHHYRSNVIHERSPLISHWVQSSDTEDDEVFVSPESNSRFMQSLTDEKREIVENVQKFDE